MTSWEKRGPPDSEVTRLQYEAGSWNADVRREAYMNFAERPWNELEATIKWVFREDGALGDSGHWLDIGTGNGYLGVRAYFEIQKLFNDNPDNDPGVQRAFPRGSFKGLVICIDKFPENFSKAEQFLARVAIANEAHSKAVGEHASPRPVNFTYNDAGNMNFPENSFDVQTSLNMLYHAEDPEAILEQIVRQAKPGGDVVVATKDQSHLSWAQDLCDQVAPEIGATITPRWYERFDCQKVLGYQNPSFTLLDYHIEDSVLAIPRDFERPGDRKGVELVTQAVLSFGDSMFNQEILERTGIAVPIDEDRLRLAVEPIIEQEFNAAAERSLSSDDDGRFRALTTRRGIFYFQKAA